MRHVSPMPGAGEMTRRIEPGQLRVLGHGYGDHSVSFLVEHISPAGHVRKHTVFTRPGEVCPVFSTTDGAEYNDSDSRLSDALRLYCANQDLPF